MYHGYTVIFLILGGKQWQTKFNYTSLRSSSMAAASLCWGITDHALQHPLPWHCNPNPACQLYLALWSVCSLCMLWWGAWAKREWCCDPVYPIAIGRAGNWIQPCGTEATVAGCMWGGLALQVPTPPPGPCLFLVLGLGCCCRWLVPLQIWNVTDRKVSMIFSPP